LNSSLPKKRTPKKYIQPIFSSRGSLNALKWYANAMDSAKSSVILTAAFGISDIFRGVLEKNKPYLRYILLDKPGKGLSIIKRDHNNLISIGGILNDNVLDQWLDDKWKAESLTGLNRHVKYVHTKYMLIDPLSDNPIVITGSANFSINSTINNDENMVIIRGNKRVADMYLGEFMRLFNHFRFRGTAIGAKAKGRRGSKPSMYLFPNDKWTDEYYTEGHPKQQQRLQFG
jgi:phosphatidylserine/phosphatidylglycerophosphate/cardiolipin synthase-like enzyme